MTAAPGSDAARTETSADGARLLGEGMLLAGRYRIAEILGAGGMGMVYRARDERLDLDVALKVLHPERVAQQRMMERFQQELILARQVSHRNVVRIHDIGQDGDVHFLTMDYVRGRSLKQILDAEGALDATRAAALGCDLAEALAAAHRENVVHRDLKPANVLVDEHGRAYVTDFGVARSLNTAGITVAGNVIGTPEYLSPEQARGSTVDGRTDIYALGLILFELLSGKLPFSGESFDEILAQRAAGEPRRLRDLGVDAPPWLNSIIERCLKRNPDDRYASAAELASDLGQGRDNLSTKRRMRRAGMAAAWLAGGGLTAGLLYLFAWPAIVERGAPDSAAAGAAPVVAVLPFVDETERADLAWISTGIAEMLAQNLAESPDLQVADSLRVFRTMEDLKLGAGPLPERQLRQLADLLDVDRLVTGKVREAARRIRVDMRLVATDRPDLPTRHFNIEDAATGDVFGLVRRLGDQLRSALALPAAEGETAAALSAVPAALGAYTEGLAALTRGDSIGASQALEAAVRHDDTFAAAWVRLADAYEQLGRRADALEAARRAVENVEGGASRIGFEARAREAALSGDLAAAQAIRAELVERYPGDIEARVALAETMGDHGHLEEAGATLEKVVAANPDHPRAWYLLGKFAILRGDTSAAADEYLVRALVIQNKLGNAQGQGEVHNALGIAYDHLGRIEHAGREYERAIELRRAAGDQRGVAASLANLAAIQRLQGDDEAARAGLEEAMATLEQIGDTAAVANLHNEIGFFEEQRGAYRAALDAYRDALRIRRGLGDQRAVAESYNNVGFTYYMLGEYDNASVYAEQAVDLFDATGNREGLMNARQTIGLLEMARGDWDAALKAYLGALETSRALGSARAEAMSLGNLGRVAQFQGRFEAAAESYAQALALLEAAGDRRGLTEFTLFESSLLLELGQLEAAAERLDRAQRWLDEDAHSEQQAMLERLRGAVRLAAGDPDAARTALDRAVERAAASGSIVAQLDSALGLGEVELELDDVAAAGTRLLEVRRQAGAIQHAVLQLRSAEALARAQWALGKRDEAEATVGTALRLAREHQPYADTYRLHLLMGEFLEQSDRGEQALAEWRAGAAEVARLKENMGPDAAEAFGALDEVRKLAQETALEPAA